MSVPRDGTIVIVGGGPAAASAAGALRDHGHEGPVIVLSAEDRAPYSRPPLSKAFLRGEATAAELQLDTAGAEVRLGSRVTSIDETKQVVLDAAGGSTEYDGLVIATGMAARRPADPEVSVLATAADADRLRLRLAIARRVVVVGSGLLSYEIASAATRLGLDTTMVVRPGTLRTKIGMLADHLEALAATAGVRVVPSRAVATIGSDAVITAESGGLSADLVIAAIGSDPGFELLPRYAASGGGILVDEWCRVAPGIVAAGDVAVVRRGDGTLHRDSTWTNANAQARAAAHSLIDDDAPPYRAVPYGWTEAFGVEVKFAGSMPTDERPEVLDGDLASGSALLGWSGGAAAIGYRIPVSRLKGFANARPATLGA